MAVGSGFASPADRQEVSRAREPTRIDEPDVWSRAFNPMQVPKLNAGKVLNGSRVDGDVTSEFRISSRQSGHRFRWRL
jgi:hypothetical protein